MRIRRLLTALCVAVAATPLAAQPLYRATEIGPLGEPYQQLSTRISNITGEPVPAMWASIHPVYINAGGQIVGEARPRTQDPFQYRGFDFWFWDGEHTVMIDLPAAIFGRILPPGGWSYSVVKFLLDDGTVVGETTWIDSLTGNDFGSDVWRWRDGVATLISPRGGEHESLVNGATLRSARVVGVSQAGVAVGTVMRKPMISGVGTNNYVFGELGSDGWTASQGSTTILTGLTGITFEHESNAGTTRRTFVSGVDESGRVYGYTSFLNQAVLLFAYAAWSCNNGVYTTITPPSGSDYVVTANGLTQYGTLSQTVFADGGQATLVFAQDGAGHIPGRDIWTLAASGQYHRLGLWGTDYEAAMSYGNSRSSTITATNRNGKVAGRTVLQAGTYYPDSADAWYFDGSTTRRVGLLSPEYELLTPYGLRRSSTVMAISDSGLLLGNSVVYQAGSAYGARTQWLHNPSLGTYRIAPTQAGSSPYTTLSPNGVVLTQATHNDPVPPGATTLTYHSMMWNTAGELIDLNHVLESPIPGPDPFILSEPIPGATGVGPDGWPTTIMATAGTGYLNSFRAFALQRISRRGPADMGAAGGTPGIDDHLDNNDFIAFINFFFAQDPRADMGVSGGLPGHDGLFDNNDFVAFITAFFEGQP